MPTELVEIFIKFSINWEREVNLALHDTHVVVWQFKPFSIIIPKLSGKEVNNSNHSSIKTMISKQTALV